MSQSQESISAQAMLTLRSRLGLTQAELADTLGISRRSVVSWESGDTSPKPEFLKKLIAMALERRVLPSGREETEIRALWKQTRQKLLLDEAWLADVLSLGALSEMKPELAPAPAQADAAIFNLPSQTTSFFGRGAELAEMRRLFADPSCRLLTLVGPGGIGKTRLSLEFALSQASQYSGGIVFVPLVAVGAPSQIAAAVADALFMPLVGQGDPAAQVIAFLRGRQLLLILDNFEHLLDGADFVAELLARAPQLRILVTSRERLNLRSEWLLDVGGLAYPDDEQGDDLARADDFSAVSLFAQRVTQVQPGFPLRPANLMLMARISRQVSGMPLAIELAAAGIRMMPLAEIERQIRTNFDVLATTLRDLPARHRSLRAVFEHSWALLTEPERDLFARLAVFRGGCTAAAAEQVAGASLPGLTTLIDKSLLRQAGTPQADQARFILLEPIREYALEKLAARQDVHALRRAHALCYLQLAQNVEAHWSDPEPTATILHIDRDYDNLRAALQWACEDGGDVSIGYELSWALRRYWQRRGYYSEGRRWLDLLMARDDSSESIAAMRARLHGIHTAAWLASDQRDYAQASALFEQSRALSRALGETDVEMALIAPEARQARSDGQYRLAVALFEGAVAQYRAQGNRGSVSAGGLGNALYELALAVREIGEFDRAAALFEECLALHRALGDREGITIGLMGLGDIARDRGDVEATRFYSQQSLDMSRELGLQWAAGYSLNNLALAAALNGELDLAFALNEESLDLFENIQADGGIAEVSVTRGQLLRARGDLDAAEDAFAESLRLALTYGPRVLVAAALEGLACIAADADDAARTARLLGAASALRAQMGTPLRPADRLAVEQAQASARSALSGAVFDGLWADAVHHPLEDLLEPPEPA